MARSILKAAKEFEAKRCAFHVSKKLKRPSVAKKPGRENITYCYLYFFIVIFGMTFFFCSPNPVQSVWQNDSGCSNEIPS